MTTSPETLHHVESFNPDLHVPTDIALLHLGIRKWQEEVGQNVFTHIEESQPDLRGLEEYYVKPGGNFFVASSEQSRVLGFIGLRNDGEGNGTVKRLAVIPELQGQGIGKALVSELLDWSENNDFTTLSLCTGVKENAKPLYESFGFVVTGFLPEDNDWLLMRRAT